MTAGRPAKPVELKRKQGTYRKDRDRSLETGHVLPFNPVEGVPEVPANLQLAGQQIWNRVWTSGASWINPATDMDMVLAACSMADISAVAQNRALVTTDPVDVRAAIAANDRLVAMLGELGFTPSARTKLGVQQVQAQSTLEKLRQKNG